MKNDALRSLVLASASPRRRELLSAVGLSFNVVPAEIDEESLPVQATPQESAEYSARSKAQVVAKQHPSAVVLAADTIVVLPESGEILNKPGSPDEAVSMLRRLSNRGHQVITGYCLMCEDEQRLHVAHSNTKVQFMPLSDAQISGYVATGHPLDKAGAYGIQGIGAFLVKEVEGSYTNVVGLPVAEVVFCLAEWGVWAPELLAKQ